MAKPDKTGSNSRAVAAKIIGGWLQTGQFPDRLIDPVVADRAFVMEVVYGVARWRRALEWVVTRHARRKPDKELAPFLLAGLYQILVMDNVAGYAAVNETVEAFKGARPASEAAVGFLNGVLRRAAREAGAVREELGSQAVGIRESHPDILVERWTRRFGEAKTLQLCKWNNTRPDVTICVNRRKTSAGDYSAVLKAAGIGARPHAFAPDHFLVLPHGVRVTDLPGYKDGLFSVQDPSTVKAVELLDPRPGARILDACAAPGGKTVLIAERTPAGEIVAMDFSRDRLAILKENVQRMGIENVAVVCGDATSGKSLEKAAGGKQFDRILLDVPCTNTGVLRRRPDARWRFTAEHLAQQLKIQRALLDSASGLLKPGGTLVYSTCSLEAEEDEEMIESWLKANPRFELAGTASIFPPDTGADGVFAAACRHSR